MVTVKIEEAGLTVEYEFTSTSALYDAAYYLKELVETAKRVHQKATEATKKADLDA